MKKVSMLLFASIAACSQHSEDSAPNHPQQADLKNAIVEMLRQTTDPFLIVEDPNTQNFIQFSNEDGRILIDLPQSALTPDQMKAAQSYFQRCVIPLKETEGEDPETGDTVVNESWQSTYAPGQTDKVVQIAFGALFEIHGISNSTRLALTKGWE